MDVEFQKVTISPIDLLHRSIALMGDQYWLLTGVLLVGWLIASLVPFGILTGVMACGMYLCYFMRMNGQPTTFETLFRGFDYFVESLIATIVLMLAQVLVSVPFILAFFAAILGISAVGDGGMAIVLGIVVAICGVLLLISAVLVPALFLFVYPLIVDQGMTAMEAIRVSCKAAWANVVGIVAMLLVYTVIHTIAACLCFIPAILFLPIAFGATAIVYREVFPCTARPAKNAI